VDYLTGRGFWEETQKMSASPSYFLKARKFAGKSWEQPLQSNPVKAILDFNRQLEAQGIKLVIMPTPVKPMIYPIFLLATKPKGLAKVFI